MAGVRKTGCHDSALLPFEARMPRGARGQRNAALDRLVKCRWWARRTQWCKWMISPDRATRHRAGEPRSGGERFPANHVALSATPYAKSLSPRALKLRLGKPPVN